MRLNPGDRYCGVCDRRLYAQSSREKQLCADCDGQTLRSRRTRLLNQLGRSWRSTRECAESCGCSMKTAQRDLASLRGDGLVESRLYKPRSGGRLRFWRLK